MELFTEWLRQQMRDHHLNCRTLARRSGLAANKVRLAVEQRVVPSAFAVRRLAEGCGVEPASVMQLAAEQVAATTPDAKTPLEREFVRLLYLMSGVEVRVVTREMETMVSVRKARVSDTA